MFRIYSLLYSIAFAAMLPLFLLRRKKYLSGFSQRLGNLPAFVKDGRPVIWIHCVSVGEANAARPLVRSIHKEFPGYRIVVSTVTRTGQEHCKIIFADVADLIFYFPFDWKFTVLKSLRAIRPNLVIVMETEIWFNFFRETRKRGITLVIANGRLSERSARRYGRIPKTIRRVLRYVNLTLVQTSADADRFKRLGVKRRKVVVTGNLKFDQVLSSDEASKTAYFRERFSMGEGGPVILAASTHEPEEHLLIEAFQRLARSGNGSVRLFIAPRHPERFGAVAREIAAAGFSWTRRTAPLDLDDGDARIVLLDSIGELRSVYPLAAIVFVGGSLIPHGGQNFLEPAVDARPIVTGYHLTNFEAIAEEFERAGAFVKLDDLPEDEISYALAAIFSELLSDPRKRKELGENAKKVVTANRGAVSKTTDALTPILEVNKRRVMAAGSDGAAK